MNDFDYEVMQKKRIARGAAHMKRGSKSKKCTLPSDHMTQAEWKRRNGPVSTYSLNKPRDWETFKSLPVDIQQSYIDILQSRFNVTASTISKELFGKTGPALKALIEKNGLKYIKMKGKNMSADDREAWEHWLNPEKCEESHENVMEKREMLPEEPEIPVEMPEKPEENKEPTVEEVMDCFKDWSEKLLVPKLVYDNCPKFEAKTSKPLSLDELTAVFTGVFSPATFLDWVSRLPIPYDNVRIKVEVTRE